MRQINFSQPIHDTVSINYPSTILYKIWESFSEDFKLHQIITIKTGQLWNLFTASVSNERVHYHNSSSYTQWAFKHINWTLKMMPKVPDSWGHFPIWKQLKNNANQRRSKGEKKTWKRKEANPRVNCMREKKKKIQKKKNFYN